MPGVPFSSEQTEPSKRSSNLPARGAGATYFFFRAARFFLAAFFGALLAAFFLVAFFLVAFFLATSSPPN